MQTPSHFLITAALATRLPQHSVPVHKTALLVGSVLSDLPFILLTLAGEVYYRWFAVLPVPGSIMEYLHFQLFFTDPLWIVSHNFFHSLIINAILISIGYYGFHHRQRWGAALFWLALSLQLHTVIDIFTHTSDGPLFLFPLNWSYRFASPVSYWEAAYYGRLFTIFEYTLDLLLLVYFGWRWLRRRRQRNEPT